jgi:hypothetical protein
MNAIESINDAFKNGKNKWNFINDEVNNVQIKLYIGVKECDLQIFKVNNLHQNIGFNYGNKTNTKKAILEVLKTAVKN